MQKPKNEYDSGLIVKFVLTLGLVALVSCFGYLLYVFVDFISVTVMVYKNGGVQ